MLYIFDLGNVIVDIDFKRVLGVWSKLSSVPLATLSERLRWERSFSSMSAVKSVMRILPASSVTKWGYH